MSQFHKISRVGATGTSRLHVTYQITKCTQIIASLSCKNSLLSDDHTRRHVPRTRMDMMSSGVVSIILSTVVLAGLASRWAPGLLLGSSVTRLGVLCCVPHKARESRLHRTHLYLIHNRPQHEAPTSIERRDPHSSESSFRLTAKSKIAYIPG